MNNSPDIQDFLIDCTVRVEVSGRRGTGFFIAPGLVLTCAHVIEDAKSGDYPPSEVDVHWGGQRYEARVIRYGASPSPNLAVLETDLKDHPCAYLFESFRPDDTLYVCGFSDAGSGKALCLLLEGLEAGGSTLKLKSAPRDSSLSGAPVLNLRTGGVCAILNTAAGLSVELEGRAIPVSTLSDLFPDIQAIHDRNHEEKSPWFDCTGIVGTVFAARSHLMAIRVTAEEPIQPILAPRGDTSAMDLLSPTAFKALSMDSGVGQTDSVGIEELWDRTRNSDRSLLVVGQAGSGRSSLLRLFSFKAVASCKNLSPRGSDCLFPILLRANQLTSGEGSVEELILNAIRNSNDSGAQTSLPSGFLSDLAEIPGLRLLIMLDGVDEIQNTRDLADLVDLIGRVQGDPGFGSRTQLVLTSRPTSAEHFRYSDLDVYEILPLRTDSIERTARGWLGDGAQGFLEQNHDLLESNLLSSPLVLSVALALYERHGGLLSTKVVELYGAMVTECLERWKEHNLAKEYGEDILKNALGVLGFLALEIIRSATILHRDWLEETVARYFRVHHSFDEGKARDAAVRFGAFAEVDSLFLRGAGERYYWSHRSFRDYFAASYLVKSHSDIDGLIKEIKGRWFDANWGKTPSFAIQLFGELDDRIDVVNHILASGRDLRLEFVTGLVCEDASLPVDVVERLIDDLLLGSKEEQGGYGRDPRPQHGGVFSFDLLLSLGHLEAARGALEGVASDPAATESMRHRAKERLALTEVS